ANSKNLGFGGGNNQGIMQAKGKYILMLNNDTHLESNCIEELKKSIEKDPKYAASACKILLEYSDNLIDAAGITVAVDGHSIGRGRLAPSNAFDKEEEVFFASDCACLFRKEMFDEIGLYDDDFFAYADETDLGWRARLVGWKAIYNPRAIVYHRHSASTGNYSSFKAFLVERNRIWVALKNFPVVFLIKGIGSTAKRYFYQARGALTGKGAAGKFTKDRSHLELIKILVKVYWSTLLNLGKILKKRIQIQRKRKISNQEIADLFKKFGITARELALKE
ncbi:MAG: glycosyltransferase family 2 protein, partial [Candidatus Omnitrophota bacterium]